MNNELHKVAFIGTGVMGSSMAGHLLERGYEVSVFTRSREKALGLVERGAVWKASAGRLQLVPMW